MWLLWSALSVRRPSQQFGKCTWTRRLSVPAFGQVGIVADGETSSPEQFQETTFMLCGPDAFELPAIIFSPAGKARTGSTVLRRYHAHASTGSTGCSFSSTVGAQNAPVSAARPHVVADTRSFAGVE